MAILQNTGIKGFLVSVRKTGNKILNSVGKYVDEYAENFMTGFAGYGWKIWEYVAGKWMLEIDALRVRGTMTVFELLISKIRSIIGALAISQGHGKIASVELSGDGTEYLITVEDDMSFVADDFIRCQTFTGTQKLYHVKIARIEGGTIIHVPVSEFDADETGIIINPPEVGDEIVQFGNETDTARQSAIYMHADENGQPAIDIMFGINSKDWTNKVKVKLGGDIPGTDGLKGFFVENGMIKGTDETGHVTYCIYPDGTAEFADKAAIFKPDKSGHIAGGNISWHWDEAAQKYRCTLSDVILSWENLSDDVKNAIKPYIGNNGNWWIDDTDTGTKAAAEDGNDGKDGMIILRGEWGLNTQYRNDSESTEDIRYLSVAMVRDNNTDSGWRAYKCLQTHISSVSNAPGNIDYWEEFPLNVAAIFTSLIIAKDAKIEFLTNNEIRILDANNNVTAGISGAGSGASGYRFWVGAENGASAPTRFAEDGSGRLAGGAISWDELGNADMLGSFMSNSGANRVEINREDNVIYGYRNDELMFSIDFLSDDDNFFSSYYTRWGMIKLYGRPSGTNQPYSVRLSLTPQRISMGGIPGKEAVIGLDKLYVLKANATSGTSGLSVDLDHAARPGISANIALVSMLNLPTSDSNLVPGEIWRDGNTLRIKT